MLEIREVKNKRDKKRFIKFPIWLYKDCPYFVPALYMDEDSEFDPNRMAHLSMQSAKCGLR